MHFSNNLRQEVEKLTENTETIMNEEMNRLNNFWWSVIAYNYIDKVMMIDNEYQINNHPAALYNIFKISLTR